MHVNSVPKKMPGTHVQMGATVKLTEFQRKEGCQFLFVRIKTQGSNVLKNRLQNVEFLTYSEF